MFILIFFFAAAAAASGCVQMRDFDEYNIIGVEEEEATCVHCFVAAVAAVVVDARKYY